MQIPELPAGWIQGKPHCGIGLSHQALGLAEGLKERMGGEAREMEEVFKKETQMGRHRCSTGYKKERARGCGV